MAIFFTDLDNTLIYSRRHEIGTEKMCVELYQGREVSFVTVKTWELLKQLIQKMLLIPVTTRTEEQYGRIDLKIGVPQYALVCNGGVLLEQGEEDLGWHRESLEDIADCREQLTRAQRLMEQGQNRNFEVRNIRQLFLFSKSEAPGASVAYLKKGLDLERVQVFENGAKVYVVPRNLNKGRAVRRLWQRMQESGKKPGKILAAGDSAFDVSMLQCADVPFAPRELMQSFKLPQRTVTGDQGEIFSEFVLERVLALSAGYPHWIS